jgi:hypothetical protein
MTEAPGTPAPIYSVKKICRIYYSCIYTNAYDRTVGRRRITKTGATYFVSSKINRGETVFDHGDL